MKISKSALYALGVSLAIAIFAGCSSGGSQSQLGPSGPIQNAAPGLNAQPLGSLSTLVTPTGVAKAMHPDHSRSWMAPDAKRKDLLYISDQGTNDVYVYSYPRGKLKGTLTGFDLPQGLCVDKKGDVWITNFASSEIVEYAHGGTSPINTLTLSGQQLAGCSVDQSTGDLAVSSLLTTGSEAGSVWIYPNGSGTPITYSVPNMFYVYFLGYDIHGNLFVDGSSSSAVFQFAELLKGSGGFTDITLNQTFQIPGGVQWHGTNVAVGDQSASNGYAVIYQFTISGSTGTEVGTTPLTASPRGGQFWIHGKRVVTPDNGGKNTQFYHYPAGGTPTKTLTGQDTPAGSTVSTAK